MMTITTSSLPALSSVRINELKLREHPDRFNAYRMILRAEQQAVRPQDIMSSRVVGCLLLEFHERFRTLGDVPCVSLVKWVASIQQDAIYDLGTLLREKFIRSFRASNVPRLCQPPSDPESSHQSRHSFETLEDMIKDTMERTDKDYKTSRRKALARDGFQCIVSGMLNENSSRHCQALLDEARCNNINAVEVKTVVILNESIMQGVDPEGASAGDTTTVNQPGSLSSPTIQTCHTSDAMTILNFLGFSDFTEAFRKSGGVHEVWNLLSLEHNLYQKFHALELWFEHTGQPDRYKICVLNHSDESYLCRNFVRPELHVNGAPMFVEFTPQFERAPPPDPRLLTLHATCARVAHMSSAAEFFDKLEWDAVKMDVLASDGSSALLLSHLISPFATLDAIHYIPKPF